MGFHFSETMRGTYRKRAGGDREAVPSGMPRKIEFTIIVRARSWLKYAVSRRAAIEGRVTVDGVATDRPLEGELTIDPVIGRVIRYEFTFPSDHGRRYRFAGEKRIDWLDATTTFTTLTGTISDEDREVADAELHFDLSHLTRFIASFRPWF